MKNEGLGTTLKKFSIGVTNKDSIGNKNRRTQGELAQERIIQLKIYVTNLV
jgi:hypothetical protein